MKILIVGAGIGGLSLAAFLRDSGIDADIIEKSPIAESTGFAIGLWANGRRMLAKLGLADRLDREGTPLRHYFIRDGNGALLRQYDLKDFYRDYGSGCTLIERAKLRSWLLELVGADRVRFGVQATAIGQDDSGVTVTFSTGETKRYDAVIGCDGIHSSVRTLAFKDAFEAYDDWRVWYAWVGTSFGEHAAITESVEAGQFAALFDDGTRALAILMAPAKHGTWDDLGTRLGRLKGLFKDQRNVERFLENLEPKDLVPTDMSRIRAKKIATGRCALLGDAAHGFEPYAGMGASMALEDAYVLAGELMRAGDRAVPQKLKRYEQIRTKRVRQAQRLTIKMRLWASVSSPFVRKLINFFIPYIPQSIFVNGYKKLLREEI